MSETQNQLRQNRISVGMCRDCGSKPFLEGKVVCQECSDRRKVVSFNRHKRNLANGICADCSKPHDRAKTLCEDCSKIRVDEFRNKRKEIKLFIINHFGNKCKECGEADIRCLSLDHVNNDGYLDKKSEKGKRQITPTWYAKLYKLIRENKPLPRELQLLCFNCHAKKDLKPWWFDDNS